MVTSEVPELAIRELINLPVDNWKDLLANDFEKPVFEKYPEIHKIKSSLYEMGALYASMSGSGSAVFAIFREPVSPDNIFPGCFSWQSRLR